MGKATVFDKASFNSDVRSAVVVLESKVEKYLSDLMQEEAKSKVDNSFKDTLAQFKKSVTVLPTTTFPEEVYKVLLARHLAEYKPPEIKIEPKLVTDIASYLSDILGSDNESVTTAEGVYKVSTTFKDAGLSTVTDSSGRLYTLTWKTDKAKTELYKLLDKLETWSQNFQTYLFNELKKDVRDALIGKWFNALLKGSGDIAKEVYGIVADYLEAGGDATDIPALTADNYSDWLSKLTKKFFPATDEKINSLRKQCQTLDTLAKDTKLLKEYKASDDLTADTIKAYNSYKKFITAYNKLQTAIEESTSNFDSLIPDYIGYKITSVVGGTFSEDNATIICATGKNNIEITGSKVSINAGKGNDTITSGTYDAANSNVKITAGTGDDEIYNYSSNSTIDAGDGNDFIRSDSHGKGVSIVGGNGNDTVDSHGNYNRIEGGAGADSISNYGDDVTISGDDGADTIRNFGSGGSVLGGAGDDDILVMGGYVDGGTGVDTIAIQGSNVTAYGGGSFDMLPTKDVFNIASGVSNVYIKDFEFGDVLNLPEGTYTARIEFGSTAIRNSSGKLIVCLSGFTEQFENYKQATDGDDSINNDVSNIKINLGAGDDTINNSGSNVSIDAGTGNDSVENNGSSVTINTGDGDDFIYNDYCSSVTIDAGAGNDEILNWYDSNSVTIDAGDGNDYIDNYGDSVTINMGEGDDYININGTNVTLNGGSGNDLISLSGSWSSNLIEYLAGDGNDTIWGFNSTSTLSISGGEYTRSTVGNDVIIKVGDGSITLKDARYTTLNIDGVEGDPTRLTLTNNSNAKVTLDTEVLTADASARTKTISIVGNELNNTITGGANKNTLRGGDGSDSIVGGKKADKLYGDAGDDTLIGNAGNDTVYGGAGNDLFVYTSGNDLIADYATGDKISLGAAISKATVSGSNVVLTTGNGSLTIKNAKGKTLSLIDSTGKELETIIGSTTLTVTDADKSPVTLASTIKTVNASSRTTAVKITGNSLANSIAGGSGKDTLSGGAGNDSISGGAGNDSINGGSGNDSIVGGAGNDKLIGYTGNDTLIGGAGNDSLWGQAGADTFIYSVGDGKDIIYGFDDTDMLEISGTFSAKYYASSDKLVFKVGSTASAITLKNFTATTFHVNGDTYAISGSKFVKTT